MTKILHFAFCILHTLKENCMKDNKQLYTKVNPALDFVQKELDVVEFWNQNDIFKKSIENRTGCPEFSFFDGPPTANGKPHVGHVLTRVVKDVIPRYKTMKGYRVQRKAGWDTHGLPVELEVEKALGIDGKQDIERYGVQEFVQKCKDSVFTYKSEWENMSRRVGYWADMQDPYVTYDDKYIESVWWALSEIHKKGLLYKGYKILPYCARCGTSLSSHEVAQGYKDVVDMTAYVAFDLRDGTYIAAWTTTPWTLPSNVALCVHPEFEYSLIVPKEINKDKKKSTASNKDSNASNNASNNVSSSVSEVINDNKASNVSNADSKPTKQIWCATELAKNIAEEYTVLKTCKGKDLVGKSYKPLYNVDLPTDKEYNKAYTVVADKFVTLDSGTGVVHIAPAYGEDDSRVGRENDLPFVQMVDESGYFVYGKFENIKFKEADSLILKDLKSRDLLLKEQRYSHSYPHCWRCDSALMYFARSSWFVAMSKLRDQLVENNDTINWIPSGIGTGRMGNFLQNVIDWGISRERYWGTPLPVWQCTCGHTKVISSKAELVELSKCDQNIELHKPYVDSVTIPCEKCGESMKRASEVIDCWFDSGCMPFAQYNYPHTNISKFNEVFPADFISEAVDQTRGWFYTLSAISTVLFQKAPFKNCIVLGHVLDDKGLKMSKHKGNVVDTWQILNKQGADALRWYFLSVSAPWLPSRFSQDLVSESSRKFIGTLWNVYSFFVLYANIDGFDPTKYKLDKKTLAVMDKWILSKTQDLITIVDNNLNEYKLVESTKALSEFGDALSNWYIRRCRERFWGSEWTIDKQNAYMTLYTVLVDLIKLAAPFVPFVTETIYQNLVVGVNKKAIQSVHLCDFPKADSAFIEPELQGAMDRVLTIVENGRAARSQSTIKNRQPLQKAYIGGIGLYLDEQYRTIIKEELNIKEIELITKNGEFLSYECKPQLRTLGAKYGKNLGIIKEYLTENSDKVAEFFINNPEGTLNDNYKDVAVDLIATDVLTSVKSKEGYASISDKGIVVALDTTLSVELLEEGFVRELVSKIQNLRKESGFEVTDRIRMVCKASEKLTAIIKKYQDTIMQDTLMQTLKFDEGVSGKVVEINGEQFECVLSV